MCTIDVLKSIFHADFVNSSHPFDRNFLFSSIYIQQDLPLGVVLVNLKDFRDQRKTTLELPFAGILPNATPSSGTITLSLMWLHDLPVLLRQHQQFIQQQRMEARLGPNAAKFMDPSFRIESDPLQGIVFSKLIVEVKEANQVFWPHLDGSIQEIKSAFIRLEVQDSITDTEHTSISDHVTWGMNFTFEVAPNEESRNDCMHLSLYCTALVRFADRLDTRELCLGSLSLPLSSLLDQKRHIGWFPLQPESESPSAGTNMPAGQVHLSLLWLHDLQQLMALS
jgi:hypothetical protein